MRVILLACSSASSSSSQLLSFQTIRFCALVQLSMKFLNIQPFSKVNWIKIQITRTDAGKLERNSFYQLHGILCFRLYNVRLFRNYFVTCNKVVYNFWNWVLSFFGQHALYIFGLFHLNLRLTLWKIYYIKTSLQFLTIFIMFHNYTFSMFSVIQFWILKL